MAEILGLTNLHTEIIPKYQFDYKITIDIIKEVTRYESSTTYYNELYLLTINKVMKRHKLLQWLFGSKKQLLYTTKWNKDNSIDKKRVLEFALDHISKIESSPFS